jgi:hypothetical protein
VSVVLRFVFKTVICEQFDAMFERGIDPDVMDPTKVHSHSKCPTNPEDWPSIQRVQNYVIECRSRVLKALDKASDSSTNPWLTKCKTTTRQRITLCPSPFCISSKVFVVCSDDRLCQGRVFQMVMEHEAMHQETLMYMIQQLEPTYKNEPSWALSREVPTTKYEVKNRKIFIPDGTVSLGAQFDKVPFGWDNEFPQHSVCDNIRLVIVPTFHSSDFFSDSSNCFVFRSTFQHLRLTL